MKREKDSAGDMEGERGMVTGDPTSCEGCLKRSSGWEPRKMYDKGESDQPFLVITKRRE